MESLLYEYGIEIDFSESLTFKTVIDTYALRKGKTVDAILAEIEERYSALITVCTPERALDSFEIIGGSDKSGRPETVRTLKLVPGDMLAIVGPTGAGKSRLLADIEWLATSDTPSKRCVLVNGKESPEMRYGAGFKGHIIAQLSQTMTFVLDSTVEELLRLHAESRGANQSLIDMSIDAANELSGEPFSKSTPLHNLSGGQTRALMVADTALLCSSPIVLIDEIENAGIDRTKAFKLLLSNEKIVLLSTHDPLLALLAPRRLCMSNGGMHSIHERTGEERKILSQLEIMDSIITKIRTEIRYGKSLSSIEIKYI